MTLAGGRCLVGEPSVGGAGVKIADRVHTHTHTCHQFKARLNAGLEVQLLAGKRRGERGSQNLSAGVSRVRPLGSCKRLCFISRVAVDVAKFLATFDKSMWLLIFIFF